MSNLFVHVFPDASLTVSAQQTRTFAMRAVHSFAFPAGEHVVVVTDERGGFTEEQAQAVIVHALVLCLRDGRIPSGVPLFES